MVEQRLLKMKDICEILQIDRVTAQRWLMAGKLPEPLRLSKTCSRWPQSEIQAWLAAGCPDRKVWETLKANR